MEVSNSNNNNNQKSSLLPPLQRCKDGCALELGTKNHKCKAHGKLFLKRCPNYLSCTSNQGDELLQGYVWESHMKNHLPGCLEQSGAVQKAEAKRKRSQWMFALVIAEPEWVHHWGYMVETHFNARQDYYDITGRNLLLY